MENPILTVAFVVAATQFFKTQFSLTGRQSLIAAFLITLFVALVPLLGEVFPAAAPWITQTVTVIALFIGAAGTWDTFTAFRARRSGKARACRSPPSGNLPAATSATIYVSPGPRRASSSPTPKSRGSPRAPLTQRTSLVKYERPHRTYSRVQPCC
jgi:hypothetical protein